MLGGLVDQPLDWSFEILICSSILFKCLGLGKILLTQKSVSETQAMFRKSHHWKIVKAYGLSSFNWPISSHQWRSIGTLWGHQFLAHLSCQKPFQQSALEAVVPGRTILAVGKAQFWWGEVHENRRHHHHHHHHHHHPKRNGFNKSFKYRDAVIYESYWWIHRYSLRFFHWNCLKLCKLDIIVITPLTGNPWKPTSPLPSDSSALFWVDQSILGTSSLEFCVGGVFCWAI